ncbi:MAG: hypothetical protein WBD01_12320 [Salaquimonas sp.]
MKKWIAKITDFGLLALVISTLFSGTLYYYWNYYTAPEDRVARSAFEQLRITDRVAARNQFHDAMGPCVQEVFQQSIEGRFKSYVADITFVATDPAIKYDTRKIIDTLQNIKDREGNNYHDVLMGDMMQSDPQRRNFEILMAKFQANPGDMSLYNCLLRYTPAAVHASVEMKTENGETAGNALPIEVADWDLRSEN